MRIGLIARAENTGLSTQTHEFYRHMHPAKTLLVDMSRGKGRTLRPELYPAAEVSQGFPSSTQFARFLDGLDVVFTAEIPYGYDLFTLADRTGVKTVLQYNFEFLDYLQRPNLPKPTLFAAPSTWHYDDVPFTNKTLLPVPIATDRFADVRRPTKARATHFLHLVGRPAIHDRNGTADLLAALPFVQAQVKMTIRCQDPRYVPSLVQRRTIPGNVELVIESGEAVNYWDNYDADVLVMPRRFGGLCLPANEALGAGMPVIMPDISPNTWLPAEWLVPATQEGRFMARSMIDLYTVDHVELAAKIDQSATDPSFFAASQETARRMAKELSWSEQRPVYEKVFEDLCSQ